MKQVLVDTINKQQLLCVEEGVALPNRFSTDGELVKVSFGGESSYTAEELELVARDLRKLEKLHDEGKL